MLDFDYLGFSTFVVSEFPMAKKNGPVSWAEHNGMTLSDWRHKWPMIPAHKSADGVWHVRALEVGSEARGALWHLSDYRVVAVGLDGIHLSPRAVY